MDLPEMAFDDLVVLVKRLGALALEAQEGAVQGLKEDGTSVTVVDGEVEAQLRAFLNQRFPGHRIMGEEGGLTGEAQSRWTWVIDPIDGTTNYAHGLPIWAVSIGLLEGGLPQWGCVFVPRLNQLFVAQRGRGATRNGRPISPLLRHRLEKEDLFGITSDAAKRWEFRMPHKLRAMGSAATQAVLVASGQLAGYFLDEWYIWDIAAALLIAQETE